MAYTDQALREQLFVLNELQRQAIEQQDQERRPPLDVEISEETMALAADAVFADPRERKDDTPAAESEPLPVEQQSTSIRP